MRMFIADGYIMPVGQPADRPMVSSIRLEEGPGHDYVHVWNRGGKSGVLTVEKGDGMTFVRRLFGNTRFHEEEES